MPPESRASLCPLGVLIPLYNEAPRVAAVLARVREVLPEAEVVAIDDGSTDGSAAVAAAAGATVIRLPFNLGYGAALQTGYRYAVRRGWAAAVQLDGDGQHEVADAPRLLAVLERDEADVALGSRFLAGGEYPVSPVRRAAMLWFAWIASVATGRRITDPTTGYQALNAKALAFSCSDAYPADFPDADVLILLARAGLRVQEAPVRMYGAPDKAGMHAGLQAAYYMFKMTLSIVVTSLRSVS